MIYDLRFTIYALALLGSALHGFAQTTAIKTPDINKDSVVATNGMVITTNKAVAKSITAYNSSGGTLYLLVYDLSTNAIPANGRVPTLAPLPVPAGTAAYWDWGPGGRHFRNGLIVCNSTTDRALTNSSANFWFSVSYDGNPN